MAQFSVLRFLTVLAVAGTFLFSAVQLAPCADSSTKEKARSTKAPRIRHTPDVRKQGKLAIVSRDFADEVKRNNDLILSTVAVKTRVDRSGMTEGYQLVQIDKGSAAEKMGFKAKDIITAVNGISARDFNKNREYIQMADRFDVDILRHGKAAKIEVEIR